MPVEKAPYLMHDDRALSHNKPSESRGSRDREGWLHS